MKHWFWIPILLLLLPASVEARGRGDVTITVTSSPASSFASTLWIQPASGWGRELQSARLTAARQRMDWPRATLKVGSRTFVYDWHGRLYDETGRHEAAIPASLQAEIERQVSLLERAHFGEPRDWQEVKQVFRRMAYARVVDLETGESFRVQRRAGSRHADVQPVTREDTAIMKQIYQGKWSWKRRAILLIVDGHRYAASMNGMPHGAGAIKGNDFPGHFCIHFRGSSTHLRREPDPAHSLMVLKASGALRQMLMKAEPHEVVKLFLLALHERDHSILSCTMEGGMLPGFLDEYASVKQTGDMEPGMPADLVSVEIPVTVSTVKGSGVRRKETWLFSLKRDSLSDRWRIDEVNRQNEDSRLQ